MLKGLFETAYSLGSFSSAFNVLLCCEVVFASCLLVCMLIGVCDLSWSLDFLSTHISIHLSLSPTPLSLTRTNGALSTRLSMLSYLCTPCFVRIVALQ